MSEDKWTQSRVNVASQEGIFSANMPWRVCDVQEWLVNSLRLILDEFAAVDRCAPTSAHDPFCLLAPVVDSCSAW